MAPRRCAAAAAAAKLTAWTYLALQLVTWISVAQAADAPMRHVSQCNFCMDCHLGDAPPPGRTAAPRDPDPLPTPTSRRLSSASSTLHPDRTLPRRRRLHAPHPAHPHTTTTTPIPTLSRHLLTTSTTTTTITDASLRQPLTRQAKPPKYNPDLDPDVPLELRPSSYVAPKHMVLAKQHMPNCTECYGCDTKLTLLATETKFMDRTYINEAGATTSWIFKSSTNMTPSGEAVVKIYCLPVPKRAGARVPKCAPATLLRIMKLLRALDKLTKECGLDDVVPRMWMAPVNAIVPGVGYHVYWHALWMEYVDGMSLENFLNKGIPSRHPPEAILDLMNNKLNKTQVVRAAIFDLLTSQCDRHAQNVFIQANGNLKLIDNEAALQNAWKNCGFDSILVPTTQKQEIARTSNAFVLKLIGPDQQLKGRADPQLLLDYRCWLPGGRELMGTQYPPDVKRCMTRVAGMTPEQVHKEYGFEELEVANNLLVRAKDMLAKGYEWAAKHGVPQNAKPKRYRFQPKCCKVEQMPHAPPHTYSCVHEWKPTYTLPLGNPTNGREWIKPTPDTGSYEGGDWGDGEQA